VPIELTTGLLMPLSLELRSLILVTLSSLTMLALKERTLLSLQKDAGFTDSGLKELPGTSPRDTLRTPRVRISSLPSPTLRSTPNVPLLNRRDLVLLRRLPSMTRTCTLAPFTSTPCVKTDTSYPSSTLSPSPQVTTRARREKVSSATKTPWLTSGASEVSLSFARRSEWYSLLCLP